ncbi:hypothetical protein BC828DRAFT_404441 [Blastocladiella britannica]|nr:hypothetical protein BC828DRAFT_404441 [Blastocladiella britannica]
MLNGKRPPSLTLQLRATHNIAVRLEARLRALRAALSASNPATPGIGRSTRRHLVTTSPLARLTTKGNNGQDDEDQAQQPKRRRSARVAGRLRVVSTDDTEKVNDKNGAMVKTDDKDDDEYIVEEPFVPTVSAKLAAQARERRLTRQHQQHHGSVEDGGTKGSWTELRPLEVLLRSIEDELASQSESSSPPP